MYILGISCLYHDSSAALLKDGKIVAAIQEERISRKKHDISFPINAIEECLKSEKITIKDIDYIGFYEKPFLKFERLLYQHLQNFPLSYRTFISSIPSWLNEKLRIPKILRKKLKYEKDIFFIGHHLSHAASSFLPSPFEKAAILSIDGVGEWTTTAYGIGEKENINLLKEIKFPTSIGLLYSTITAYLGFSVNNSEYKVMGLAPYGNMNKKTNPYYEKLMGIIDVKEDGSYRFDMSYFIYHYKNKMPSKKLCSLLGGNIRKPESDLTQRHKDIAAALQLVTEDIMTGMLNNIQKTTKCDNLVLCGGVALNSVYNGKILRNTKFKRIWMPPDPGDGGTSTGAALYAYNTLLGNKRNYQMKDAYLGLEFSDNEIKKFLQESNIKHREFKSEKERVMTAAKLIYENNVLGWFQGKMEWGPRALGARSILSNPTNKNMQEILNLKVKHREKFRPFAPVVCIEDADEYFECDKPIPEPTDFMLMVYPVRKKWQNKIPAVTHVDGSGRLQTVRKSQNAPYHNLIKEFGKLSGIPILINTSFNIRGEPIVCTPYDAYKCMMGTGIDYLIMGNFLIKREDNPQDMWDSEKYATD
ncbi:MAG: carbamoyltransferase [Nanoarchaeota archaeon]|nr:carbamoyltransferase [Nanoarchaeota archaeon]